MPCRNSDRPRLETIAGGAGCGDAILRKDVDAKARKNRCRQQHYLPDRSTTAAIMSAIARHLATEAPVLVLSGTPGSKSPEPVSAGEPTVVEIKNRMPGKAALFKRAIAEISFTLRTALALLARLRRGDVVLTVTAPFMLPYAVAAAARLRRARSVLIMHDLYPDVLVMAGVLQPTSIVTRAIHVANSLMF